MTQPLVNKSYVMAEQSSDIFDKRIRHGVTMIVLSRGRELPKAGSITGVKS